MTSCVNGEDGVSASRHVDARRGDTNDDGMFVARMHEVFEGQRQCEAVIAADAIGALSTARVISGMTSGDSIVPHIGMNLSLLDSGISSPVARARREPERRTSPAGAKAIPVRQLYRADRPDPCRCTQHGT